MIKENTTDRVFGTIFGQAVGDALGLGTEFLTKSRVKKLYPDGLKDYSEFILDSHREHWTPGEWTDDTDQMLCIMDSIITHQEINILDIAQRIHKWAFNGGRGIGQTVLMVLTNENFLNDPHSVALKVWEDSGQQNAANGAVMRTSVLGLWQYQDEASIRKNAENVCKITHFDPRCIASSVAVSLAISRMVRGETDIEKLVTEIASEAMTIDNRMSECFQQAMQPSIAELQLDDGGIGYTLKATASGFWALLNCTSFDQGIESIINEGGDADTNAAVGGALLGARFGYQNIPDRLKNPLIGGESLLHRSEKFLGLLQMN